MTRFLTTILLDDKAMKLGLLWLKSVDPFAVQCPICLHISAAEREIAFLLNHLIARGELPIATISHDWYCTCPRGCRGF
jgi:hypothetical protein